MVSSRTATAIAGLVLSAGASVLLYWYTNSLVFFLVVPFVPFLLRGESPDQPAARECPECGFRTRTDDHAFCPRDGTRLE